MIPMAMKGPTANSWVIRPVLPGRLTVRGAVPVGAGAARSRLQPARHKPCRLRSRNTPEHLLEQLIPHSFI